MLSKLKNLFIIFTFLVICKTSSAVFAKGEVIYMSVDAYVEFEEIALVGISDSDKNNSSFSWDEYLQNYVEGLKVEGSKLQGYQVTTSCGNKSVCKDVGNLVNKNKINSKKSGQDKIVLSSLSKPYNIEFTVTYF